MSETTITTKPDGAVLETRVEDAKTESTIFGVSVRSLVALILVASVCGIQIYNAVRGGDNLIGEPLYGLTYLAVGFLFGKGQNPAAAPLNTTITRSGATMLAGVLTLSLLTGCARFSTTQTDLTYDQGQPLRSITTKATATTFAASKAALQKWKASQTDQTQGASVGTLDQSADATPLLQAVMEAAMKVGASSKP